MYQNVAIAGNGALPIGSGDKRKRLESLKLRCLRCFKEGSCCVGTQTPSGSAGWLVLSVSLREMRVAMRPVVQTLEKL